MKIDKFDEVIMLHDGEFMPDCCDMEPGQIYVSDEYKCAKHLCPCGCGEIVVMTLDPHVGWTYDYDAASGTISFHPSVGNFNFPCQSHYYIHDNVVRWV